MTQRPLVTRIQVKPRLVSSGAEETLYLAGGGDRAPYLFGGQHYRAGVISSPRFHSRIQFDENGWTGGVVPTTGELSWAPSVIADYDKYLSNYHWKDAAITIERGEEGADGSAPASWALILEGAVDSVSGADGVLTMAVADLSAKLDKPFLSARFAGTGGIEGVAEASGRIKRRTFGQVFNVPGELIDKANSIYEFSDPAFPLQSFLALRDKGREANPVPTVIAWQGTQAATLAALIASTPVPGSGVVAPSIACAKWWTQPSGPLTADLEGSTAGGYTSTVLGIAARVLAAASGPALEAFSAAINASPAATALAGLHIADDKLTTAQVLDQLLQGSGLFPVLLASGQIRILEFSFSNPVASISSALVQRERNFPPIKSRRIGYKRNHRIHTTAEISAILDIARGDWAAGVYYYYGDVVQYLGASYQAVADHLSVAGAPPPNANWKLMAGAGLGSWTPVMVGMERLGTGFRKISQVSTAYDSSVRSAEAFAQANASFRAVATAGAMQLGLNGTDSSSGEDIDYAMVLGNAGALSAKGNGATLFSGQTYAAGDVLSVRHRGTTIQWLKNGTAISGWAVSNVAAATQLYLDSSFADNRTISDVTFASAGDAQLLKIIYIRATSQPLTPSGNGVPAGWSGTPPTTPATSDLYMSQALQTLDGITIGSWSTPINIKGPQGNAGTTGTAGRDAVVFYTDSTPGSPVVGDTWITVTTNEFKRWNGSSWEKVLGDVAALMLITEAYIAILSVGTAKMQDLAVTTLKVAGNAITAPTVTEYGDSVVPSGGGTVNVCESPTVTIGDIYGGAALIMVFGYMDSGFVTDCGINVDLEVAIDAGGFVLEKTLQTGARVSGGDVYARIPATAAFAVSGQTCRVRVIVNSIIMPGASGAFSSTFRAPTIVIMGCKR